MTKEEIIKTIEEQDVAFIRLQFTDIFGQLKNVAITRTQIEKALNNQIMIDGSSIEGFTRIHESDQYLYPDLNTFAILPWFDKDNKVARIICDVYNPDGTPSAGDPRGVLKRVLNKAAEEGYTFNVGPECEFFLFETDGKGHPTNETTDQAGYFDMAPLDHGGMVRRQICLTLEKLGYEIEASHHETSAGQHEIDFKYTDALAAADNIMTFKMTVKTIAQQNGMHATFMPKPVYGVNGSGMHTNMSIFKDGKNIFFDENGERLLSKEAYSFIAGLMKHVKAFTALTNPLVNSYKRIVPGFEAPCYVAWSASNRTALIRIPAARGNSTRVELRSPDPSCNPYLALAACLASGIDGVHKKLTPPDEVSGNIFQMNDEERRSVGIDSLPATLYDAVRLMKEDELIMEVLGGHISSRYITGKIAEWDEFRTQITDWELNRYMVIY